MYTNIFRKDETNIGDWYSSPNHYFPLNAELIDIWRLPANVDPKSKNVIYGGGGLIGQMRPMTSVMLSLKQRGHQQFAWGLGDHSFVTLDEQTMFIPQMPIRYPSYVRLFDAAGLRDYHPPLFEMLPNSSWVPCASCMHSAFDKQYDIEYDFVIYEHQNFPLEHIFGIPPETYNYPRMNNKDTDFDKTIEFLASGETVITSSYHGAYWAMLLKRKVIAFPWCSKFYGLRTQPEFCQPQEWVNHKNDGKTDLTLLDDARYANKEFYKKVQEMSAIEEHSLIINTGV